MNLQAIAELEDSLPGLDLIFVESGDDNLAASFSPEHVDNWIYVMALMIHNAVSKLRAMRFGLICGDDNRVSRHLRRNGYLVGCQFSLLERVVAPGRVFPLL
ncbi:MAG: hypothetical protein WB630_16095, partial [Candidatus Acidiferrales bacterium]